MLLLKEWGPSSGSVNVSFKRNLGNATTAATSPLLLPGLTLPLMLRGVWQQSWFASVQTLRINSQRPGRADVKIKKGKQCC